MNQEEYYEACRQMYLASPRYKKTVRATAFLCMICCASCGGITGAVGFAFPPIWLITCFCALGFLRYLWCWVTGTTVTGDPADVVLTDADEKVKWFR